MTARRRGVWPGLFTTLSSSAYIYACMGSLVIPMFDSWSDVR